MSELELDIQTYFGVPKHELALVVNLFDVETLEKGAFFNRKGTVCHLLSFVKSGYLRVYKESENKEVTQWISANGSFVTDAKSFFLDERAEWNIQALTDCILFTITKTNYHTLEQLVSNWRKLETQFILKCFVNLEERVFDLLSLNTDERFLKLFDEHKELFTIIPQQYLASMLGMATETLSRIKAKHIS